MDLPHVRFIGRSIPLYASMSRSITIHIDTLNKLIQSTISVVTRQSESGANNVTTGMAVYHTHIWTIWICHFTFTETWMRDCVHIKPGSVADKSVRYSLVMVWSKMKFIWLCFWANTHSAWCDMKVYVNLIVSFFLHWCIYLILLHYPAWSTEWLTRKRAWSIVRW